MLIFLITLKVIYLKILNCVLNYQDYFTILIRIFPDKHQFKKTLHLKNIVKTINGILISRYFKWILK